MRTAQSLRMERIEDPDRLDEVTLGRSFKVRPLLGAPFRISLVALVLGEIRLETGSASPFVGIAGVRDGYAALQLPFGKVETLVLNGTELREPVIGAHGPGAELQR